MRNLPLANGLTFLRIILIPVLLYLCFREKYNLVIWLLIIALGSDFIDGKLARALNQTSPMGALLDPVADKLVVLTFFPYLYLKGMIPLWFVILVVVRDLAQLSSIPILNWILKIQFKVRPAFTAKLATALNFLVLWLLFVFMAKNPTQNGFLKMVEVLNSWFLIPLAAFLEVYVLITYLPRFYRIALKQHDTFE